ncbi:heterokaryon incompatibility protein [Stagonosporopsis vannaccii]|nr:heterokaryon incompatibility protein [Stagonosporopsis vannaccii]
METTPSLDEDQAVVERPHIYSPLPPGEFFRSLALEPGSGDEPLRCTIRVSAIADTDYIALSYVWGSGVKDQRIYCDNEIVSITTNLFQALRRLRRQDEVRHLWADSVCIDQDNITEKSLQVALMGQIYRNARRVLIYMGSDPDKHGPKLASLLNDTYHMIQCEIANMKISKWNSFPDLHEEKEMSFAHDERWRSYVALFEQPWFERGWVVREAGLAREGMIIWGDSECSWKSLMYTAHWIQGKGVPAALSHLQAGGFPDQVLIHRDIYWDRYNDDLRMFFTPKSVTPIRLLDYLAHGRHLQFGDRRDNIYAFLDLETSSERPLHLIPDYTQPPNETFRMFAAQYINTTGDISILNYVIHDAQSIRSGLPTWVPRWVKIERQRDDGFWRFITEALHRHEHSEVPEIVQERILRVRGNVFDKLHFVSNVLQGYPTSTALLHNIWQDVKIAISQLPHPVQYSIQDFVRFLAQYNVSRDGNDEEEKRYIDSYVKEMLKSVGDAATVVCKEEDHKKRFTAVHYYINRFSSAKRIMITERGHIGFAPIEAREGDVCARLSGSTSLPDQFLYLLRGIQSSDHYQFVGPARLSPWDSENTCGERNSEGNGQTDTEQDFFLC